MSRGLHKHGFEPVPLNQSKTPSRFNSLLVLQSPLSRFQVDLGPAWAGGGRSADIPIPGNGAAPTVPVPAQSQRTRPCAFIKQTSPKILQGNAVFPPKTPSQRPQLPGREAQSCFLGAAGGEGREGIPGPGRAPRAVLWDDPMERLLRFGFQGCVRELCSARDATENRDLGIFF